MPIYVPQPAKSVVVICEDGSREEYSSLTRASRELQVNKSDIRQACKTGRKYSDVWFKFTQEPDPQGCPGSKDEGIADIIRMSRTLVKKSRPEDVRFRVTLLPHPNQPQELQVYCEELGDGLVTTFKTHNNTVNASQLCAVTGGSHVRPCASSAWFRGSQLTGGLPAGHSFHQVFGPAYPQFLKKLKALDLPVTEVRRGLYMYGHQVLRFVEELEDPELADFMNCLVDSLANGRLKDALELHAKVGAPWPMRFNIEV